MRLERSGARRAALFVVFAGAAFSVASPLARWAHTHWLIIAFGRLAVAAVVLLAIEPRTVIGAGRALPGRLRAVVLLAGLLLAAHFGCFFWGLEHTSLPAAVSLVSLEPLAVVMCAWVLLGVAPSRPEQLGVVLATAGAVVVAQGAGEGKNDGVGDLLVVAAVVLFGLYLTVARALKDALPARSYAALVYTGAAVALLAALALAPEARAAPAWPLDLRACVAIVMLGLVPTLLGHTAVQTASRSLPPAVVALVSPAETVGSIAIGAALMGEAPSGKELVGAAIIVAGSVLAIAGMRSR